MNALVGIAPNNHGTTLSGLTNLLPYVPGARDLLTTATPALAQQMSRRDVPPGAGRPGAGRPAPEPRGGRPRRR